MEGLRSEVQNIVDQIVIIQDPELSQSLSLIELNTKKEHLTQLLENLNQAAIKIKETASPELQENIDREVKRVQILSNGAFNYIETLIKENQEVEAEINPKDSSSSDSNQAQTSAAIIESNLQSTSTENSVGFESTIMNSIVSQIRSEFNRLLNDPQFFRRSVNPNEPDPEFATIDSMLANNSNENSINEPILGAANPTAAHPQHPDEFFDGFIGEPANKQSKKDKTDKPTLQLKFDKIQIQNFSGKLTDWIAFRDQFSDLVHTNPNLTDITKFYQLQTHLSGSALDVVNGFGLSADNYESAWKALMQRFDNKLNLIFGYIKQFFDLPVLPPHANKEKFLQMIDKTRQMLSVLQRHKIDTTSWDTIVIYCLQSRLNPYSLKKWKEQIKRREDISLTEMFEFLEVEGSVAPYTSNPTVQQNYVPKRKIPTPRSINNALVMSTSTPPTPTVDNKCHLCKADHPIFRCTTFLALDVATRLAKARQLKICPKCLNKHSKNECKFGNCRSCNLPHNHLLCTKRTQENPQNKEKEKL